MAQQPFAILFQNRVARVLQWSGLATSDTGTTYTPHGPAALAGSVTITGTFNGGTARLLGSDDLTNWFPIRDTQGVDIALTAAGRRDFSTAARALMVDVQGGTATGMAFTATFRG